MKTIRRDNFIAGFDIAHGKEDLSVMSIVKHNFNGTCSLVHNEYLDKDLTMEQLEEKLKELLNKYIEEGK